MVGIVVRSIGSWQMDERRTLLHRISTRYPGTVARQKEEGQSRSFLPDATHYHLGIDPLLLAFFLQFLFRSSWEEIHALIGCRRASRVRPTNVDDRKSDCAGQQKSRPWYSSTGIVENPATDLVLLSCLPR
jgi:hypothetical protein